MISLPEITAVLKNDDPAFLEQLARRARRLTRMHFGNTISLYAPLYLSNYCENFCTYCGFNCGLDIHRSRLTPAGMEKEMACIARKGIRNLLLLTGESPRHSPPSYLKEAVILAGKYFSGIGVEIYPLQTEEYKILHAAGVDSVTVYQETYDRKRYAHYHPAGRKRDYDYRYQTPQRAAEAGIPRLTLGVLFGLGKPAADLHALYRHLEDLMKRYPGVEYALSVPRIIPLPDAPDRYHILSDRNLAKVIALTRILFPSVGINLSTREPAAIRDRMIHLGVTRISAESKTMVGGYYRKTEEDAQFYIKDQRSVGEILRMLKSQGLDPVFTDWRRIGSA